MAIFSITFLARHTTCCFYFSDAIYEHLLSATPKYMQSTSTYDNCFTTLYLDIHNGLVIDQLCLANKNMLHNDFAIMLQNQYVTCS